MSSGLVKVVKDGHFFAVRITLQETNVAVNDVCLICGNRTEPTIPITPYGVVMGSGEENTVCEDCVREHAPPLFNALRLFYRRGADGETWTK